MISIPTDSDPTHSSLNGTFLEKCTRWSGALRLRLIARVTPLALMMAAVSVVPVSASSAGLFSAVFELFSGHKEPPRVVREYNSQNAAILEGTGAIDPATARGGGDIVIKDGALIPDSGLLANTTHAAPHSGRIGVYVVREGDTLSQIAQMYGVSVNTILWANNIKRGVIHTGDILIILPVSGVKYTVARGDTLASIAKKYKGDADEIALFNGIASGGALAAGSEIIIPGGEIAPPRGALAIASRSGRQPVDANGYYTRPIKGGVRTQGIHGYNGVDLATHEGAPLYAAAAGRILISREGGWNGGYGNYIVIEHDNGTQTLYSHNSRNVVAPGVWVAQGEIIGYVGSTGRSTGPHVHFEVRGAKNPF